jgi:hypothetical protein
LHARLSRVGFVSTLPVPEARQVLERALGIKEKVYGPDHHEVGITFTNLGNVLRMLGRLDEAREAEERALRVFEQALPANHPYIFQAGGNLPLTLDAIGEGERAAALRRASGGDSGCRRREVTGVRRGDDLPRVLLATARLVPRWRRSSI